MIQWDYDPEEDPDKAQAEALQVIAKQLLRIADKK